MKNQNDLICIGVCGFLSIVAAVVMFFMKREPVAPAPPSQVITTDPQYPAGAVTYSTSLSGGSNAAGGFGGGGMGGRMGGMGMGAMGGGPMGRPGGMGGPAMGANGKQRGQSMVGSVNKAN